MLNLTTKREYGFISNVDAYVDTFSLEDLDIVESVIALYNASVEDSSNNAILLGELLIYTEGRGFSLGRNIPTGYKVLIAARHAIRYSQEFSCYSFLIGANLISELISICKDTNLVSLVFIDSDFMLGLCSETPKKYKVFLKDTSREGYLTC